MESIKKELILNHILSGYTIVDVIGTKYIVGTPDIKLISESNHYYNKILHENRFAPWLNEQTVIGILIGHGLWSLANDNTLKELEKSLEDKKVQLFHSYWQNKKQVGKLRKEIDMIRKKQNELYFNKHSLDNITLEGFAEKATEYFLFSQIILDKDYNKLENIDYPILNAVITKYRQIQPTLSEYRELAKTEPWRSFWTTSGLSNFNIIGNHQRTLLLFSKMYDNIYENADSPAEEIIADDDLLDGWLISTRRKRDKEREESFMDTNINSGSKHGSAGEIIIPANSSEDIDRIQRMNDIRARMIQKQRKQILDEKGKASDLEIPAIQTEVREKTLKAIRNRKNG